MGGQNMKQKQIYFKLLAIKLAFLRQTFTWLQGLLSSGLFDMKAYST